MESMESMRESFVNKNLCGGKETVQNERSFAEYLQRCLVRYWRERNYAIETWIDLPEPSVHTPGTKRRHYTPVFGVRSNIGTNGFPPREPVA